MRTTTDCRTWPSDTGCSLTIAGTEEEVVAAAAMHAVAAHGHADTGELREQVRATLVEDRGAGRYGTVMLATLTGNADALQAASEDWAAQRRVPGFLVSEVLLADDGRTVVLAVFFEDRDAYQRLADDPAQDRWYSERIAPHLTDVRWLDGTWRRAVQRVPSARIPAPSTAT